MKAIADNTYDFENIRTINALYVDKTAYFHRLVSNPARKLFFISRPRRFGKSLMLSTLKNIFLGRRELFKELAIDSLEYDWKKYCVIAFDFSGLRVSSFDNFKEDFIHSVSIALREVGYTYDTKISAGANFELALSTLAEKAGQVVVLVDEYDAPIGHVLQNIELAKAIRDEMSAFYTQLKKKESCIRFLMMTGVSKFTKLSLFSSLNNLTDLTFDAAYATMLGYTEDELGAYFDEHMRVHAEKMKLSYAGYRSELKRWYNGYRFSRTNKSTVYNPIAIAKTLATKDEIFTPTWTETGHPSFIMACTHLSEIASMEVEKVYASSAILNVCELETLPPVSLLFQTGYLTIKDYNDDLFELCPPNDEVRKAIESLVLQSTLLHTDIAENVATRTKMALKEADVEVLIQQLKACYAGLTYHASEGRIPEASYQRILHMLFVASGVKVISENRQAKGIVDIVAQYGKNIYIIELKVDATAEEAYHQILEQGYATPYLANEENVYALALNFSSVDKNIVEYKFEQLH